MNAFKFGKTSEATWLRRKNIIPSLDLKSPFNLGECAYVLSHSFILSDYAQVMFITIIFNIGNYLNEEGVDQGNEV